ncbi:MAG: hypothetical protein RL609_1387, partial [Bacteroidota bacterium]
VYSDDQWGGYGQIKPELVDWMRKEQALGRLWDRVYTAKMMYALTHDTAIALQEKALLVIHTGGLQGNRSLAFPHP